MCKICDKVVACWRRCDGSWFVSFDEEKVDSSQCKVRGKKKMKVVILVKTFWVSSRGHSSRSHFGLHKRSIAHLLAWEDRFGTNKFVTRKERIPPCTIAPVCVKRLVPDPTYDESTARTHTHTCVAKARYRRGVSLSCVCVCVCVCVLDRIDSFASHSHSLWRCVEDECEVGASTWW